jgi:hypothetical protein
MIRSDLSRRLHRHLDVRLLAIEVRNLIRKPGRSTAVPVRLL